MTLLAVVLLLAILLTLSVVANAALFLALGRVGAHLRDIEEGKRISGS